MQAGLISDTCCVRFSNSKNFKYNFCLGVFLLQISLNLLKYIFFIYTPSTPYLSKILACLIRIPITGGTLKKINETYWFFCFTQKYRIEGFKVFIYFVRKKQPSKELISTLLREGRPEELDCVLEVHCFMQKKILLWIENN